MLEERQLIRQENLSQAALLSLVRTYLLHAGFHTTLLSLDKALKERSIKAEAGFRDRSDLPLSG